MAIGAQRLGRRGMKRQRALVAALARDGDRRLLEVDVALAQAGRLRGAHARSVEELQQRAVAKPEHRIALGLREEPLRFALAQDARQLARRSAQPREVRERVARRLELPHGHHRAVEAAQHHHVTAHRRVAVAPLAPQVLDVVQHVARRERLRTHLGAATRQHPGAELLEHLRVRRDRRRPKPPRRAVRPRVERDPVHPPHDADPSELSRASRSTASRGRPGRTCR